MRIQTGTVPHAPWVVDDGSGGGGASSDDGNHVEPRRIHDRVALGGMR